MSVNWQSYLKQSPGSATTTEGTSIAQYLPTMKLGSQARTKYPTGFQSSNTTGKITSDQKKICTERAVVFAGTSYLQWLELLQTSQVTSQPGMTSFHPFLTRYLVLSNSSNFNLAGSGLFLKLSCFHKATKLLEVMFSNFWQLNRSKSLKLPEETNFCKYFFWSPVEDKLF